VATERLFTGIHWTFALNFRRSNSVQALATLAPLRPEPIDGVSMRPKESGKVRYAYGVAMALLLGGTAILSGTGPAGAQVAQNPAGKARPSSPPWAAVSFPDLVAKLQPAV